MPSVEKRIQISAPADEVWTIVRDFGAIDEYVPQVAGARTSGEGTGSKRTLTLEDGTEVVERLDALDEETRTLRYSIVEGPLPIRDYDGALSVQATGEATSEVTWTSTFEVTDDSEEEMTSVFEDLYMAGLNGLKKRYGPSGS